MAAAYQAGQRGTPLSLPGIAGWAGAAESGRPGAPSHAWFIGYAPVEAPRYAVAVIVEYEQDGWQAAAPVGVEMLNETLARP